MEYFVVCYRQKANITMPALMLMTMEIYNLDMKLNVCEKYTSMKVSTSPYFTNCLSLPVVHRTKADVSL